MSPSAGASFMGASWTMDQAVAKDVIDAEASFVVGIIIIAPTPPKIIAPLFE